MSIEIMTYRNPYQLHEEPYWNDIKSCPYFCVSQTTVNGLKRIYPNDFKPGRVATIQRLTSALFKNWETTESKVCQHTAIDNIISDGLSLDFEPQIMENVKRAFRFNRDEVYNSLRVMFELDVDIDAICLGQLTYEQRFIVEIYREILGSEKIADFTLEKNLSVEQVDRAVGKAMQDAIKASNDEAEITFSEIEQDRIVIHGVHQFSSILLRTIEEISKYKRVILLFNYQPQYKNVYQTWVDIYTAFDCPITDSTRTEFHPDQALISYSGNLLADILGKLVEGRVDQLSFDQEIQITEFDNMTEFAGYVAQVFENARSEDPLNPMGKMREQIYSANGAVNDILKIYFPEQFGERQFLDYPLGHFFLAIANMWDSENNQIQIASVDDIRECFDAGILKEDYTGQISTIFGKVEALFDGVATLDEMIKRLRNLNKNRKYLSDPEEIESLSHISYYSLSKKELDLLICGLNELQDLAQYFYEDFEKHAHNFREFYRKLKGYLQQNVLDAHELDEDFADIISRVLERLEEVKDIDASASFECLKSTMSIYLVHETNPGKSANWIVRNFEQIDGDITRSNRKNARNVVYHFV